MLTICPRAHFFVCFNSFFLVNKTWVLKERKREKHIHYSNDTVSYEIMFMTLQSVITAEYMRTKSLVVLFFMIPLTFKDTTRTLWHEELSAYGLSF